jgi:hypothetical protein
VVLSFLAISTTTIVPIFMVDELWLKVSMLMGFGNNTKKRKKQFNTK